MVNGMARCPITIESLSHFVRTGEALGKLDVFWGRNSFRENVVKSKVFLVCLRCFDAVGWAAGRASGL